MAFEARGRMKTERGSGRKTRLDIWFGEDFVMIGRKDNLGRTLESMRFTIREGRVVSKALSDGFAAYDSKHKRKKD